MEPSNTKTLLLADDEQFIVIAYKDGLERAGYKVVVAHDGEEVLQQLATVSPDLILLDLIMPKMNGFEVLKVLKADPTYADIPVMVLSNLSQPSDEQEAREYGIVDFVVKANASMHELQEKIDGFFARSA